MTKIKDFRIYLLKIVMTFGFSYAIVKYFLFDDNPLPTSILIYLLFSVAITEAVIYYLKNRK